MDQKTMALVENIYLSLNPRGSFNYKNIFETSIKDKMESLRIDSLKSVDDIFILDQVSVSGGIQRYPYGFEIKDKLRIFFASNWSDNYPIYVIMSAFYLHNNSVEHCINETFDYVYKIINYFVPHLRDFTFDMKLSRIDICNHNNFINLKNYIKVTEYNSRVVTRIRTVHPFIELHGEYSQEVPYYRYGNGDFCVRFYNKVKEVCEQQYKAFFFKKWLDNGLIDDRVFNIYEHTYKLNNNYRIDFIYSNVIFSDLPDNIKSAAEDIYNNTFIDNDVKFDLFNKFLKDYKIKCVQEIVNVEFQLRHSHLKNLRIKDDKCNIIDYTDLFSIIKHLNLLYRHLTLNEFRVVDRCSKASRKRDKKIDPLWERIILSDVLNVQCDGSVIKIYNEYNTELNKFTSVRDSLNKLVHAYYVSSNNINFDNVYKISIDEVVDNFKSEFNMNENFFNLKSKLEKQIKYYGEKSDDDLLSNLSEDEVLKIKCIIDSLNI